MHHRLGSRVTPNFHDHITIAPDKGKGIPVEDGNVFLAQGGFVVVKIDAFQHQFHRRRCRYRCRYWSDGRRLGGYRKRAAVLAYTFWQAGIRAVDNTVAIAVQFAADSVDLATRRCVGTFVFVIGNAVTIFIARLGSLAGSVEQALARTTDCLEVFVIGRKSSRTGGIGRIVKFTLIRLCRNRSDRKQGRAQNTEKKRSFSHGEAPYC